LSIEDHGREASVLSTGRFDLAVLLTNSFRTAWVAWRAGIPERWGYSRNVRGWMLSRPVKPPRGHLHQYEHYNLLVRSFGIDVPETLPWIHPIERTRARACDLLAREGVGPDDVLVGMAPGAAYGHAKRWPPARVAELATRLMRERGARSMLFGSAGDRDAARAIESALPPDVHVINLIGRTDLRVLIGLLERCRAFVSNDSGAMHLAAAAGVPVTAIFGPTDERVTRPLGDHDVLVHQVFCRPCMLRDCPIDHRCMKGITVDAAFASVVSRLEVSARA
jgi:heptosyltransferase-2